MTFNKPKDISYTDMCIYIDNTVYKPDITEEEKNKVYEYLYHILYVLACKSRYFQNFEDYDSFALYGAYRIYMRFMNQRQFEVKDGERKLEPIKSVLNYIKNTIYGLKVNWQQENYCEVFDINSKVDVGKLNEMMKSNIQKSYSLGVEDAVVDSIKEVCQIAKYQISKSPYRNDKLLCHKLYNSCLLSLLNEFTLNNESIEKLSKREENRDELFERLYAKEREDSTILWHLDESYYNYVKILTNKVKNELGKEIIDTKNSFILPEDVVEAILTSSYVDAKMETNGGDANEN